MATRGRNIDRDVMQLIDKYEISDILDIIFDTASPTLVQKMKEWFGKNLGVKSGISDDLDDGIIKCILHDMEHINMRLAKLERAAKPDANIYTTSPYQSPYQNLFPTTTGSTIPIQFPNATTIVGKSIEEIAKNVKRYEGKNKDISVKEE